MAHVSLPPVPEGFSDHQYGIKHGVPLWLRIWPADVPENSQSSINNDTYKSRPWLLWVHGGAYCSGQHYQLRNWLLPLFRLMGVHVVSIAHRFAPQVSMEDMLEDCSDAFLWCRQNLSKLIQRCDVGRYVIGGDSAGAGLATLLAYRLGRPDHSRLELEAPPLVVINVYGVTDLVLQQALYDQRPPETEPWAGSLSEDEVKQIISDRDPRNALTTTTNAWNLAGIDPHIISQGPEAVTLALKAMWKVSDKEWRYTKGTQDQWDVKSYIGHQRLMVSLPLRLDDSMTNEEQLEKMKAYSVYHLLDTKDNNSSSLANGTYPPTVFLHGTGDTAVPVDASKNMARRLREMRVDVEELYCEGTEHGWENLYTCPTDAGWDQFIAPLGRFVGKHLFP